MDILQEVIETCVRSMLGMLPKCSLGMTLRESLWPTIMDFCEWQFGDQTASLGTILARLNSPIWILLGEFLA